MNESESGRSGSRILFFVGEFYYAGEIESISALSPSTLNLTS